METTALHNKPIELSIEVNAPASKVWQALTDPAIIEQYFFGSKTNTTWQEGSPIVFTGQWQGQSYTDKGTVLKVEKNKLLQHSYWSSMGGLEDIPENYLLVTYRLEAHNGYTRLTVTQDRNSREEETRSLWKTVLDNLKRIVENQ